MTIGSFMPEESGIWKKQCAALSARFPECEFIADPKIARVRIGELDAMLAAQLPEAAFDAAKNLKALFVPFTGLNHLPLEKLIARNITVFNVHGNAESVAERALALALAFFGRIVEYHNDLKQKQWHGFWVNKGAEDDWTSIFGKKCAIFGTGAIGQALAKLLKAFDCEVTGYRRRAEAGIPPHFDGIETDLGKAIADAELLFITLPLTPKTKGLFSHEVLLKARGKFLVNVGRGEVVDEEGLYLALKDGILIGAGIDTWYVYPKNGSTVGSPSRFPIIDLPNVILSPHAAGSTGEAIKIAAAQTFENISSWIETGTGTRKVNLYEVY